MSLLAHGIAASSGATDAVVGPLNTTNAKLIVCALENIAGANFPAILTDSQGNTWVFPITSSGFAGAAGRIANVAYCISPSTSPTHTFTMIATGGAFFPVIAVQVFDNVPTSGTFDAVTAGAETAAAGTTVQPGSLTPANANNLFISFVIGDAYTPISVSPVGFIVTDTLGKVGGVSQGGGMAYVIQSAATAQNPTWTVNNNDATIMSISIVFKESGGAAPTFVPYQPQYQMAPIMAQ